MSFPRQTCSAGKTTTENKVFGTAVKVDAAAASEGGEEAEPAKQGDLATDRQAWSFFHVFPKPQACGSVVLTLRFSSGNFGMPQLSTFGLGIQTLDGVRVGLA